MNIIKPYDTPPVSVIIPTLNAEKNLDELLSALTNQSYPLLEILVIDSSSEDNTVQICQKYSKVNLFTITRTEFDHGRTRDFAVRHSHGDIVVFLTQDALPTDSFFLNNLIAPFKDTAVAISVGRQLPKMDANRVESLVRNFNYPAVSFIRSWRDISQLGIKAFFCSDACAAYKKSIYLQLGGFDYPLLSNEDMFFAAKALQRGYKIAYTAEAKVFHSHNFTLQEQYRRNYLQGYEIERHKKLLNNAPLNAEGLKLVKSVSKDLLLHRDFYSFFRFGLDCCARWLGNKTGKYAYRRDEKNAKNR